MVKKDKADWGAFDKLDDEAIAKAVSSDPDAAPLEAKGLRLIRRGRPRKSVTKKRITIRLSPDVVDAFRATGKGWQTRVDEVLKDWLEHHRAA
ncbi:MAG: BrnA antitoxin family protein, partial [Mariprofundaceae bacterium]|nr:BrnA antitoxin family protein [Mariprofundaceae bacterium]